MEPLAVTKGFCSNPGELEDCPHQELLIPTYQTALFSAPRRINLMKKPAFFDIQGPPTGVSVTIESAANPESHNYTLNDILVQCGPNYLTSITPTGSGIRHRLSAGITTAISDAISIIILSLLDVWIRVQHRHKRNAKYSDQVERVLYEVDVFWTYAMPWVGLAGTIMAQLQPHLLDDLKPILPCLMNLVLGGLVFMGVGRFLKTAFPEGSVFAMILSKAMLYAVFYIISLIFLPHGSPWRWAVYIQFALLSFTALATVGYSIWKEDVRAPENAN